MTRARAPAQMLLISSLLLGCGRHTMSAEPQQRPARDEPVSVEVENHNWSDMVIYLDRGNLSERLGTVGTLHTSTFAFPYLKLGSTGNTHLRADPIGNLRSFSSEQINIQPGQSLKWTIESDIDRSFLSVY